MANVPDAKRIDACVAGCAESHQRLLEVVDALADDAFAGDSHLPGWTRSHVVGHLALNARSHVHLISCAMRGEQGEQYPGGAAARAAAIDEASGWLPADARRELRRAVYELEGGWAGASAEAWQGTGLSPSGLVVSIADLPFLRWRETVVHLADLDAGYTHQEWPHMWVRLELDRQKMAWAASHPMGLTQLPAAANALDERTRLAWLLGRLEVDGLPKGLGL
ncbi:MAG: hypothetical protein RLY50_1397 [Actinomycetota bacterium]